MTPVGVQSPPLRVASARASGRPLGWWGTVAMITTEAMVFALLLFAYQHLRAQSAQWPLGGIAEPELFRSGMRTIVLLASSIPIHQAHRGAQAGDRRRVAWGLATGLGMAALFMVGHVDEWAHLLREFGPGTNAYGSLFFTITGLHAVHLLVGMAVVAHLWAVTITGRGGERYEAAISVGTWYWHFVDVVWIFVYGVLYLGVTLP